MTLLILFCGCDGDFFLEIIVFIYKYMSFTFYTRYMDETFL